MLCKLSKCIITEQRQLIWCKNHHVQWYIICIFIGKLDILPMMCVADHWTDLNPHTKLLGQCVSRVRKKWLWYWKLFIIKHILTSLIKAITPILKISTYIITVVIVRKMMAQVHVLLYFWGEYMCIRKQGKFSNTYSSRFYMHAHLYCHGVYMTCYWGCGVA